MSMIKPKAVHFYMSIEEKEKLDVYAKKVGKSHAQILREYINTLDTTGFTHDLKEPQTVTA